jgi:uncharacterized protein
MLRLEDLTPGMELKGTIVNVVPFGAFVDIGLKDTGLVHISRMANKFIKNPYEVVGVGDVISVWVVEVDNERKRASLTMVPPGQERKPEPRPAFAAPPPRPPRAPRPDRPTPPRPPRPAGPHHRQPQDRAARFQRPRPAPTAGGDPPAAQTSPPMAPPAPPKKPGKPKPLPKLSSDALSGKSPLGSFAELEAFFKTKDDSKTTDETPPAPPEPPASS